jgi:hypothetical protein
MVFTRVKQAAALDPKPAAEGRTANDLAAAFGLQAQTVSLVCGRNGVRL